MNRRNFFGCLTGAAVIAPVAKTVVESDGAVALSSKFPVDRERIEALERDIAATRRVINQLVDTLERVVFDSASRNEISEFRRLLEAQQTTGK